MSQVQRFRGWSLEHNNMHIISGIYGLMGQSDALSYPVLQMVKTCYEVAFVEKLTLPV